MKLATNASLGTATSSVGVPSCRMRPVADDPDPLGQRRGVLEVVGHQHGREAQAVEQLAQLRANAGSRVCVERGERLVEEEHSRIARERPGKGNPLALAARELAHARLGEVVDPEALEQGIDVRAIA